MQQTLTPAARDKAAKRISYVIEYGDASGCVMKVISALGRNNLPRSAREMNFAAQDYMRETGKSDLDAYAMIDHMVSAPRRAEWPA